MGKSSKVIVLGIIVVLMGGILFGLWSISSFSYQQGVAIDGFTIHEGFWNCYVSTYEWDGISTEVTIPMEYNGKPITSLGGYFERGNPCQFHVENLPQDKKLVLKFGKNIRKIEQMDFEQFSKIIPSKDNTHFYSEDGKLYSK